MFSYKPLFHKLIEKNLKKTDLQTALKLSPSTLAKLSKNEFVSMDILNKICNFLECNIDEIITHIPDNIDND